MLATRTALEESLKNLKLQKKCCPLLGPIGFRQLQRGSGFSIKLGAKSRPLSTIQHGFLDFRKAFWLSTILPLKRPTIFNSLGEIGEMARHRNYRNYAYEDGKLNVPLMLQYSSSI